MEKKKYIIVNNDTWRPMTYSFEENQLCHVSKFNKNKRSCKFKLKSYEMIEAKKLIKVSNEFRGRLELDLIKYSLIEIES